jgi:hypothetical protein
MVPCTNKETYSHSSGSRMNNVGIFEKLEGFTFLLAPLVYFNLKPTFLSEEPLALRL